MRTEADILQAWREGRVIVLDFPVAIASRPYGQTPAGQRIAALCAACKEDVLAFLGRVASFREAFNQIPITAEPGSLSPHWANGMLPGLDAMALYTLIRDRRPHTYLEIGSGNSTKFVRRAIVEGGLSTKIISIDPHPRAEVDALCDQVIRRPLEDVALDCLPPLRPNDVVFIDNSHMSLPNSDVTVFFTEFLPQLPSGVLYGVHDIFLPDDYASVFVERYYNEQYLLASYLLGGADGDRVVFPGLYVSSRPAYREAIAALFAPPGLEGVERHAGAFWLQKA